jgi:drug/metabolite transporter (DMT)-like permease
LAQLNPGIAYGCMSITTIFSAIFSFLIFKERITPKMIVGIVIVVGSVGLISFTKNSKIELNNPELRD